MSSSGATITISVAVPPVPPVEPSAEELAKIAAWVDASARKDKLNTVDKRRKLSEARHRAWIESDEQLLVNVINFDNLPRPQLIARQRAFARAAIAWLEANPGDDMDEEHRALHLRCAGDDIERAGELARVVDEIENIENDWEEGAPSRTCKILRARRDENLEGAGSWLTGILTVEQVALLEREVGKRLTWRSRPRWRLERQRHGKEGARVILLDVHLRARLCESFEQAVRWAVTQRDVRALLACWATEAELVRDEHGPRFVGRGFTIYAV